MQKYNFNSDQRVLIPYFMSTPMRYNLGIQTLMMWCAKLIDRNRSRWCEIEKTSNNFYKTYVRITFLKSLTKMHTFDNPRQTKVPHWKVVCERIESCLDWLPTLESIVKWKLTVKITNVNKQIEWTIRTYTKLMDVERLVQINV